MDDARTVGHGTVQRGNRTKRRRTRRVSEKLAKWKYGAGSVGEMGSGEGHT